MGVVGKAEKQRQVNVKGRFGCIQWRPMWSEGSRGSGAGDLTQTRLGNSLGLRLSPVGEQRVWW